MKPQWRTLSVRINPKTRKACAVQSRFPWTQQEWDTFMARMEQLKPELVEDEEPAPAPQPLTGNPHIPEPSDHWGHFVVCECTPEQKAAAEEHYR